MSSRDGQTTRDRGALHEHAVMVAIIALSLVLLAVDYDLPIVRNSLIYAKITATFLADGLPSIGRVANDSTITCGKPIGFSLFAWPFAAVFGANHGLKIASWAATVGFVFACRSFFRRFNERFGLDERAIPLELCLVFANALLAYEFWSGYPDPLFAALSLAALNLLDDLLFGIGRRRWKVVLVVYFVTLYAAVMVKNFGLVNFPAHAALVFLHDPKILKRLSIRERVLLASLMLVVGALLFAAWRGSNPTFRLGGDSGGVREYAEGLAAPALLLRNLPTFGVFLILTVGVLIPFALRGLRGNRGCRPVLAAFAVPALLLLCFKDSYFNVRFFIVLSPCVAALVARGLPARRVPWLVVQGALGLGLIANFNVPWLYARLQAQNEWLSSWHIGRYSPIDSLRIGVHVSQARIFSAVNRTIEPGGHLVLITDYYHRYCGDLYVSFLSSNVVRPDIAVAQCVTPSRCPSMDQKESSTFVVLGLSTGDRLALERTRAELAAIGARLSPAGGASQLYRIAWTD